MIVGKYIRLGKNTATVVLSHKRKDRIKVMPWHKTPDEEEQVRLHAHHVAKFVKLRDQAEKLYLRTVKVLHKQIIKESGITPKEISENTIPQKKINLMQKLLAKHSPQVTELRKKYEEYNLEAHREL